MPCPTPFLVMATQNPIESEGVYPLPEAQRDRFLMKVDVGYPTAIEELEIVHRMSVHPPVAHPVLDPQRLVTLQAVTDDVFVHHALAEYAVRLVLATREPARYGLTTWTASSPSAAVRAPRSASSRRPGRWRCCAAATTCCRRTSATSRRTCCSTAWCCPSRRSPTGGRPRCRRDVVAAVPSRPWRRARARETA